MAIWLISMKKPNDLSNCCQATVTTDCGDEGTCCYICTACKRGCDTVVIEKTNDREDFWTRFQLTDDGYLFDKKHGTTAKRKYIDDLINQARLEGRKEAQEEFNMLQRAVVDSNKMQLDKWEEAIRLEERRRVLEEIKSKIKAIPHDLLMSPSEHNEYLANVGVTVIKVLSSLSEEEGKE